MKIIDSHRRSLRCHLQKARPTPVSRARDFCSRLRSRYVRQIHPQWTSKWTLLHTRAGRQIVVRHLHHQQPSQFPAVIGLAHQESAAARRYFRMAIQRRTETLRTIFRRAETIASHTTELRTFDITLIASTALAKDLAMRRRRIGTEPGAAIVPSALETFRNVAPSLSLPDPKTPSVGAMSLAPRRFPTEMSSKQADVDTPEIRRSAGRAAVESRTVPRLTVPDLELDRITARVLDSIDRRIVADRERMGRIS